MLGARARAAAEFCTRILEYGQEPRDTGTPPLQNVVPSPLALLAAGPDGPHRAALAHIYPKTTRNALFWVVVCMYGDFTPHRSSLPPARLPYPCSCAQCAKSSCLPRDPRCGGWRSARVAARDRQDLRQAAAVRIGGSRHRASRHGNQMQKWNEKGFGWMGDSHLTPQL